MKILSICMFLGALLHGLKKEPNEYATFNLKGRVKNIYESIDFSIDSAQSPIFICSHEYQFDKKGNYTKFILYFKRTDTIALIDYTRFDSRGNKVEFTEMHSNGEIVDHITFEYDASDRLIRETDSSDYRGALSTKYTYKTDASGNIIERDEYPDGAKATSKNIYTYHDSRLISASLIFDDGYVASREVYSDDSVNGIIEQLMYGSGDTVSQKTSWQYDATGHVIEMRSTYPGSSKSVMTYDEEGNMVRKENTYLYAGHEDHDNETDQYEYDKNGNWISQKISSNGQLIKVMRRKIVYYN